MHLVNFRLLVPMWTNKNPKDQSNATYTDRSGTADRCVTCLLFPCSGSSNLKLPVCDWPWLAGRCATTNVARWQGLETACVQLVRVGWALCHNQCSTVARLGGKGYIAMLLYRMWFGQNVGSSSTLAMASFYHLGMRSPNLIFTPEVTAGLG